jgi:uncharacterized cupredoxin-like copper-binding protein
LSVHVLGRPLSTNLLPAALPAGVYYLVAKISDPLGNVDFVTLAETIDVAAPYVALSAAVTAVKPAAIAVNKSGTVTVTVTNTGNISAAGTLVITVTPSADGTTPAAGAAAVTITRRVTIKPGKSGKYGLKFKVPASLAGGLYVPLAAVSLDGVSISAVGSAFTAG